MTKHQAFAKLVEASQMFSPEEKQKLMDALPTMNEEDMNDIGYFLAQEVKTDASLIPVVKQLLEKQASHEAAATAV